MLLHVASIRHDPFDRSVVLVHITAARRGVCARGVTRVQAVAIIVRIVVVAGRSASTAKDVAEHLSLNN